KQILDEGIEEIVRGNVREASADVQRRRAREAVVRKRLVERGVDVLNGRPSAGQGKAITVSRGLEAVRVAGRSDRSPIRRRIGNRIGEAQRSPEVGDRA